MPLIFFGSSEFSLHALKACIDFGPKQILVITTPPQKKGRGLQESPTRVQEYSQKHQIPCHAPAALKNSELISEVENLKPDYFVVSSYGKMIPSSWLKIPKRYAINVHPSLLPKYRGAAPINWPLILGDKETGVSLAEVTAELDAGDLFFQKRYPVSLDINASQMTESLGRYSYEALKEIFAQLAKGDLKRTPQNHAAFNYARKLTKDDGRIQWNRSAEAIHNQVRGLVPWPIASFEHSEAVQILKTSLPEKSEAAPPGSVVSVTQNSLWIQTGQGVLSLDRVKPSGRKEMSGGDYARGKRLTVGTVLKSDPLAPNFVLTQSYK